MEIEKSDLEWLVMLIVMIALGQPITINLTIIKQKPRKKRKKRNRQKRKHR